MGKVVACINLTLDGVLQAPARPDEDQRDGFSRGGWAEPYAAMSQVGEVFGRSGALLLGRRTYEDFTRVWPNRPESPFTPWLTKTPKYVASRTLREPLPWANSTLLGPDVPAAVARLKQEVEKDILIVGSGELIQSLMGSDLVDEYVLLIHPLVLGAGRRLFGPGVEAKLTLVSSVAAPNGVLVTTYQPSR